MKEFLLLVSCLFVISAQAMEDRYAALAKAKYAALLAQEFDKSVSWNALPLDLMKVIKDETESNNKIVYPVFDPVGRWTLPYTLRSIGPVKLKRVADYYGNIQEKMLVEPRYWYCAVRLSSNNDKTHDNFELCPTDWTKHQCTIFDGINNNQLALVAECNEVQYKVYVLKQSNDNSGKDMPKQSLHPVIAKYGYLQSVLLHRERNRCVLGIKNVDTRHHKNDCVGYIDIKNIYPKNARLVASRKTDFVLKKAVYVGENNYLGLTEEGNIVVFWLDGKKIKYNKRQNCHGKQFKDIAVDETVKTKSGFMPRVALLATNGEVFLTDLRMGGEKKVLLYSCTLENHENIFRFFYDKGQCAVVYKKEFAYDTFHMWPDNFNMLLAYLSLKSSQQKVSEEENKGIKA